jgi:RNase P/RNase MRP subunit POP5
MFRIQKSLVIPSRAEALYKIVETADGHPRGIIPGNRGTESRSWFGFPLRTMRKRRGGRQLSPAPLGGVATVRKCESGAARRGAIRNRARAESGATEVSTVAPRQLPRG